MSWIVLILLFFACLYVLAAILWQQWSGGPYHLSPVYRSMPESDYASFWAAGQLARRGHAAVIYSASGFQAFRQDLFGPAFAQMDWLYPPDVILIAEPFSYLPLFTSFVLWLFLVFCLSVFILRLAGLSWFVILAGLAGPATWRAYELGQIVPLVGSLVFAGLVVSSKRPALSGAMLGFATLKPQLGMLAPIALVAARRWRAIIGAGLVAAALGILTIVCCGGDVWILFLRQASAHGRQVLETMFPKGYPNYASSVFWMLRAFGLPLAAAYWIQAASAIIAAILTWVFCRKPAVDDESRAMLTGYLSLLVSPYLYASDLVIYSIATALLMQRRGKPSVLLVLIWIWPGISDPFTLLSGLPVLPCFIAAGAWITWRTAVKNPIAPATTMIVADPKYPA